VHLVGGHAHGTGDAGRVDAVAVDVELEAHGAGFLDFFHQYVGEVPTIGLGVFAVGEDAEDELDFLLLFGCQVDVDARERADHPPEGHPEQRHVGRVEVADGADVLDAGEGHEQRVLGLDLDHHEGVLDAGFGGLDLGDVLVQAVSQGLSVAVQGRAAIHEDDVHDLVPTSAEEGPQRAKEAQGGVVLGESESSGLGSLSGIHHLSAVFLSSRFWR